MCENVEAMVIQPVLDEAGVDLVLSGEVRGHLGACEVSPNDEGEFVEECIQVVAFEEGVEMVTSRFDSEGGLPHLGKERDGLSD